MNRQNHQTVDYLHTQPAQNPPADGDLAVGVQFEQWQRPPSRQKEPNLAVGLDDPTRPKTRGTKGTHSIGSMFFENGQSASIINPRERKRNIGQYLPKGHSTSNAVVSQTANKGSSRSRMIDFFHQRNNNANGFNSTSEGAFQFIMPQEETAE